jgi:GxxExxY protein
MTENQISYHVRGVAFKIHKELGPGLLESVYEELMAFELKKSGFFIEKQKSIAVLWEGIKMNHGFRADIVVNKKVILEIKSVETIAPVHFKQLATYVKLTGIKLGLLINFNEYDITKGIKRYANGLKDTY